MQTGTQPFHFDSDWTECMQYCTMYGSYRIKSLEHTNTHTYTHPHAKWCALNRYIMMHNWAKDSCDASTLPCQMHGRCILCWLLLKPVNCQLFHWSPNRFDLCAGQLCWMHFQLPFGTHVFDCDLPYSALLGTRHTIILIGFKKKNKNSNIIPVQLMVVFLRSFFVDDFGWLSVPLVRYFGLKAQRVLALPN